MHAWRIFIVFIFQRAGFLYLEASMSLVSLVGWNVSLGSADVSWGGVRAIRTAAKETMQMVVKGKRQGKLLLQNIYMYMIVTLEVVYDLVGKCRKLAFCYFIQISLILFCLTTIWK